MNKFFYNLSAAFVGALIFYSILSVCPLGCSSGKDTILGPSRASTSSSPHKTASLTTNYPITAWLVRYRGFPDIPDTTYGLAPIDNADPVTYAEFTNGAAVLSSGTIAEADSVNGDAESYVYPFVLFPNGSKYDRFQLSGTLLCADYTSYPVTFQLHTEGKLQFAGSPVGETDNSRNLSIKRKGATLVVGESDNISFITGAHVILPGNGKRGWLHPQVWISHVGRN